MNQEQVLSAVRWLLTVSGPSIIATGWVSGSMWENIAAMAPSLVGLLWGLFVHTDANAVKTAKALTGGVPIAIGPSAPASVQALAADRSEPLVVPASLADMPPTYPPSPYATTSRGRS